MQRGHDPAVEARRPALFAMARFPLPAQEAEAGPGRHDEGHQKGKQHGRRGADRDGPHVGPHQPPHKGHGNDRGDDGKGGQDGRVPHFIDRLDGDLRDGPALILGQVVMADDILHHHDGVVHQDADGEDERKEGDAVQGVAVEIEDRQGEGQGDRDGDAHDPRFPQTDGQPDQDGDREDGDHHVQEKLIGFLFGRLPVISRNRDLDVARDQPCP